MSLEISLHSFVDREWCQDDLELASVGIGSRLLPSMKWAEGGPREERGSVACTSHTHLLALHPLTSQPFPVEHLTNFRACMPSGKDVKDVNCGVVPEKSSVPHVWGQSSRCFLWMATG